MDEISQVRESLLAKLETLEDKRAILRAPELRALYGQIKDQPEAERAAFGQAVNALKQELEEKSSVLSPQSSVLSPCSHRRDRTV